jgi:hypothetical protein
LDWLIEFADFNLLPEELDHHFLNKLESLSNPTKSSLPAGFGGSLRPTLPLFGRVVVGEMCTRGCGYEGQDD